MPFAVNMALNLSIVSRACWEKVFFFLFFCGYDGFPPKPEKQNSQIPIKSWTHEIFDIWILERECYGVL